MNIKEFRKNNPNFNDVDDANLTKAIHQEYFSDVEFNSFSATFNGAPYEEAGVFDRVTDTAIDTGKGVVEMGRAGVGLLSMATGGLVSDAARDLGYDPERTVGILEEGYSDERKHENQQVNEAEGFTDTFKELFQNPSTAIGIATESLISSLGIVGAGRVVGKKVFQRVLDDAVKKGATKEIATEIATKAARKATFAGTAAAEGSMQAGSAFDEFVTNDEIDIEKAYQAAIGSGLTTAAISFLGGRLGEKVGLGDVESDIAGKEFAKASTDGVITRGVKGALQEGVLEEAPQSATEQMWSNFAEDKPLDENVGKSVATGLAAGGIMGGGMSAVAGGGREDNGKPTRTVADIVNAETDDEAIQAADEVAGSAADDTYTPDTSVPETYLDERGEVRLSIDPNKISLEDTPVENLEPGANYILDRSNETDNPLAYQVPKSLRGFVLNEKNLDNFETDSVELAGQESRKERLPENINNQINRPERLLNKNYRMGLEVIKNEIKEGGGDMGALIGGEFTNEGRVGEGDSIQRAKSENPEFLQEIYAQQEGKQLTYKQFKGAIDKALSGTKLGIGEARVVESLLDFFEGERTDEDNIASAWDKVYRNRELRSLFGTSMPENADPIPVEAYSERMDSVYKEEDFPVEFGGEARAFYELYDQAAEIDEAKADEINENISDEGQAAAALWEIIQSQETKKSPYDLLDEAEKERKDLGSYDDFIENGGTDNEWDIRSDSVKLKELEAKKALAESLLEKGQKLNDPKLIEKLNKSIERTAKRLSESKQETTNAEQDTTGTTETDEGIKGEAEAETETTEQDSDELNQEIDEVDYDEAKERLINAQENIKEKDPELQANIDRINDEIMALQDEATLKYGKTAPPEVEKELDEKVSRLEEELKPLYEKRESSTQSEYNDLKNSDIDSAANEAATSPENNLPEPTEAQIEAGNYKKGHVNVQGLDVTIENPKGSTRSGTDPDGKAWSQELKDHYGYIKRTQGADDEQVDVFVGEATESEKVFIVNQHTKKPESIRRFDEHKIMIGYNTKLAATAAYNRNYQDGWDGLESIHEVSIDEFKMLLNDDGTFTNEYDADDLKITKADKPKKEYGNKNTVFTADAAEEARKLLKSKLGQLNAGLDPEIMKAGITLAGYHIEAGARSFADFTKAMIDDLGEGIQPYLRSFYESVRHYPEFDNEGMTPSDEFDSEPNSAENDESAKIEVEETENVPIKSEDVERDSESEFSQDSGFQTSIFDDSGRTGQDTGSTSESPGGIRANEQSDQELSGSDAATDGEPSNLSLFESTGELRTPKQSTGSAKPSRSGDANAKGTQSESSGTNRAENDAREADSDLQSRLKAQKEADASTQATTAADAVEIESNLPVLLPLQREDVVKAEARIGLNTGEGVGRGMMFTNGTGTGKTFTGLGVAKRFEKAGRDNIIITVPSDKIANDWVDAGKAVGLNIKQLGNTKDNGKTGIVVTTYANFGQNYELVNRDWDLIIPDESHYLSQNKSGDKTLPLNMMRALTHHPAGRYNKARYKRMDEIMPLESVIQRYKAGKNNEIPENETPSEAEYSRADEKLQVINGEVLIDKENYTDMDSRVLFLSATPFAYEKSTDYAEGYLFNYAQDDDSTAYNHGSNQDQFMMEKFGYRMRYNKLTAPESGVNSGLMQRQFNEELKKEGSLSGRKLDVEADYSREFVMVEDELGNKIDEGLDYIREAKKLDKNDDNKEVSRYPLIQLILRHRFNYLERLKLLEALKAKHVVERAKKHQALGRKVVVFHSYKVGGAVHPFKFPTGRNEILTIIRKMKADDGAQIMANMPKLVAEINDFAKDRSDLIKLPLDALKSPIETFKETLPNAVFFNGDVPKKKRRNNVDAFNDDEGVVHEFVAQLAAGKEGISLHDTTGKHQRVEINIGLPTRPTDSIQLEGRVYRTGQVTDAIQEYLTIGTSYERTAFADAVATRSSTAENLALGEGARDLLTAFVEAYADARVFEPHEGQGKGNKESDSRQESMSDFERAEAYYYSNKKRTSQNKAEEGADYFATPEPLGLKMVEFADLKPNEDAAEPSVGHGAIGRFFPQNTTNTFVEPSGKLASRAALVVPGEVKTQYFEDLNVINKYDAIVMNPPFGTGGKVAMEHLEKAYKHLRNRGRIVALIPEGSSMEKRLAKWQEEKDGGASAAIRAEFGLPNLTFERAGTKVKTRILVIDKIETKKGDATPGFYNNPREDIEAEDIREFFDNIEDLNVPDRLDAPKKSQKTEEDRSNQDADTATVSEANTKKTEKPSQEIPDADKAKSELTLEDYDLVVEAGATKKGTPTWGVKGEGTYLHKETLKSLGARWYRPKQMWTFYGDREDPSSEILEALNKGTSGESSLEDKSFYGDVTDGKGYSKEDAENILSEIIDSVADETGLEIRVIADQSELPEKVQKNVPLRKRVKGYADFDSGIAYVVASNNTTPKQLKMTLAHELIGHLGVESIMDQDSWLTIKESILAMEGEKNIRATGIFKEIGRRYGDLDADTKAKEFIALATERRVTEGNIGKLVRKFRAAIRKLLQSFGITGVFKDAEIDELITDSMRYIKTGERANPDTEGLTPAGAFSLVPPVWSAAFKKFIKGSVIKEAVYHGTNEDFSETDRFRIFWGSTTPDLANAYALTNDTHSESGSNIMPVYFSIKNAVRFVHAEQRKTVTDIFGEAMIQAERSNNEIDYDAVETEYNNLKEAYSDEVRSLHEFWHEDEAFADLFRAMGFDGVATYEKSNRQDMTYGALYPENIKSVHNRGTYNKDDSNILFSLEEDTEDNRRLREENKTLASKVKKMLRRELTPGGLLPDEVFDLKINRDNKMAVEEFQTRHLVGEYENAVKKDYKVTAHQLKDDVLELHQNALTDKEIMSTLPENTKVAMMAMRDHIDNNLTKDYMSILQGQITELEDAQEALLEEAQGVSDERRNTAEVEERKLLLKRIRSMVGEANMNVRTLRSKAALLKVVQSNIGTYAHRSYAAFDDKNWFKRVPDKVLNDARDFLNQQYIDSGEDVDDARNMANVAIKEILNNGTAYESMISFIRESKLGAKDMTVLMKKKNIAPEIRALMGEYKDPRVNFARTTTKMARLIWNDRFLERVKEVGMGTFLFTDNKRPPEASVQLAGDASSSYAPLNGVWTYPEIKQAFQDAMDKPNMDGWYSAIIRANGAVKFGKTVLSPTTAMRNWQSAMFFTMANGHFDLTHMTKSFSAVREYFTHKGKGEKLEYLKKLKDLGVVYDTPYAGEMMRLLEDSQIEQDLLSSKGKGKLKDMLHIAQKFYQFGDDFWKIIGFENEKRMLMKHAKLSLEEAEVKAAERIRNTYPTYSMVGKFVNNLRRFPLAGTFVSFPSEIVRTSINMLRYMAEDMKTPGMRPIAMRRAAGLALVSGFAYALQEATKQMFDVDDDDEEAVRLLAAPWQRNSNFIFTGRDELGNMKYIDLSFLDPYNYWKRPINAILRDQPWEDMATDITREMVMPFFGVDIAAGAIFEVVANKKMDTGGEVFKDSDKPMDQLEDMVNHLRKTLQPGLASNLERTWKAIDEQVSPSGRQFNKVDEAMAWGGWRLSTLNPKVALNYRTYDFKDQKRDATRTFTEVANSPNPVDDDDLIDAYDRSTSIRAKAYNDLHKIILAAQSSGLSRRDIIDTLRKAGISKKDALNLYSGRVVDWLPSKTSERNALKRADILFNKEIRASIANRYRFIRSEKR
jgi:inorganic pyrophosphatase-like protein/type III restriction/modification enzyme restriction subunit/ADP-ribosyltransferase-like protein